PLGDQAAGIELPPVAAAEPAGGSVAGLLTHLHRDHADAAALAAALRPGAPVLAPAWAPGEPLDDAALLQARAELDAAGLALRQVEAWETVEVDGWSVTALPAADGLGDPQVSWLAQRDGAAALHGGDTLAHGWWWRIARRAAAGIDVAFLPINAAVIAFPHRRPAIPQPAAMGGREAVAAARALQARRLVPIHFGAYDSPVYRPDPEALARARAAARELGVALEEPALGAWFDVGERVAA
ncbi:MAG TPA: MBL fold metallo-hydrolase, partial [Capillimicrobium sp.]